jgi:Ca2+-binding RTX toxin-like protein
MGFLGLAMRASFVGHGAVSVSDEDMLVGVMDLEVVQTSSGTMLFTATRGDGWLSAFDLGNSGGDTRQAGAWSIAPGFLQLESTDIEIREIGSGNYQLYLAGLASGGLRGVTVRPDQGGDPFGAGLFRSASGLDARQISEMALWDDDLGGMVALRSGGLAQVSFGAGSQMQSQSIAQGGPMSGAVASGVITATTSGGQTVALVSYGSADTISLFRMAGNGTAQHRADISGGDGLWVDRPGAMTATVGADGGLYIVVASSGSGSLSVLSIDADGHGMQVVDHVIDTLDTRFDDASHVTTLTVAGQDFVFAAGSDSGLSLFVMLPGGRLQHVETVAGSVETPLHGITGIEAVMTPGGARVFVTTQSAPYLAEFSLSFDNLGVTRQADARGGTVNGSTGDDILIGGQGDDLLQGGAGDDIIMDGAGADSLRGGGGADLFILTADTATDVILDFQPQLDQIDISALGLVGGLGNLLVLSRSWGAELRFGTSVIEVRSANGSALSASDFGAHTIIASGRPPTDPQVYLETDPIREPVSPYDLPPTRTAGPLPDAPVWTAEQAYYLPSLTENLQGGAANDFLRGSAAEELILGNAGNDTIIAGSGRDSISGDGGADWIDAGASNDLAFGGTGFDTIHGGNGNDTLVGGLQADSLFGGGGRDILIGGDGFDRLYGGGGNDTMWSGSSADRLYGGDGNDWMSAGINFGLTVDGLWGEDGNDTLFGDAGFDLLDGGNGDDVLDGGAQADNLFGRDGDDTLFGGQGLDRLFGGEGNDQLVGGTGNDGHFGEIGNDTAWGGSGNDRFFGGIGNDILMGQEDRDTLYGGAGFDTLVGGQGDDLLFGNFNADRFVFVSGHGNDTIADFNATNILEVMDFTGFAGFSGFDSTDSILGAARQVGQDVLITTGANSSIRLVRVDLDDLGADDFLF